MTTGLPIRLLDVWRSVSSSPWYSVGEVDSDRARVRHRSFRIYLRRQLLILLGAHRLGSPERDLQSEYPIDGCLNYDLYDLDVQLVSDSHRLLYRR